mgnify:CR=1 FL=1
MDLLAMGLFALGLVLLVGGAELLVRGAAALALAAGISPLVIGLTVVAYGTSAPELAVTVLSAWDGQADIALGNVVGSNIFNVLVILGLTSVVAPVAVASQLVRREVPIMVGVSLLALVMALDGRVGRIDGVLLATGIVAYTVLSIRLGRRETREVQGEYAQALAPCHAPRTAGQLAWDVALVVLGLVVLMAGSKMLVYGAVTIARALGVGELLIGLTIVAAGTSLPELATSVVAALRGQRDIAVGNVVGSSICNILGILGVAAMLRPVAVSEAMLALDLPFMVAVAVACLPIFYTGNRIARWEGALFLAYYVAYTVYLAMDAVKHESMPTYRTAMEMWVTPLTAVTLAVLAARAWIAKRRPMESAGST